MTLAPSPKVSERFDRLCKAVAARGRGLSLSDLGDCHALARELEADAPDPERVELFVERLGLGADELEE